ncbi:threonine aldolase family protein [Aneurinibacillus migulanus]|uniref:L-threonine aldolase n=2 Tax=Aneurinibacillus migulanus TaxID=47500 RepID=A0A1G8YZX9_ANEMI|nr:low specificity L-threonine aldolase [Aneurinibacillus migulanus]KIV58861.1 threonine aldolase [Aneurinibacillus migulanus]MED0890770.1 low specificity L-threonine aldolase [Aneurinibacillus migulanus]MED1618277.1 low specificity L-threonine aldolase [Aneurinibacillus migulanus]MED4727779.1 low specificity L-threonine aldolase [Aneurinibacillus migulanus]SDK08346.1 L-threonine aldolase [Aneurinibacillus migulanus]
MPFYKSFASDNYSGVHPEIMESIIRANVNHVSSYGNDPYSEAAVSKFKEHFGDNIDVYFVFNGTAANVLGLKAITRSYNSIICAETSHIHVDECGAPEYFTGCKTLTLPTEDGKLYVDLIKQHLTGFGDQHHSQPKVISIAQPTELGTVYKPEEIQAIATFAHEHGMLLHMDGSRLSNAAASLKLTFKEITVDVGVDVLSFGGTKNGLMIGEAIVFFDKSLATDFKYIRKQGMQLGSKMRFIAAQFEALLSNDLWLRNARNANDMAKFLAGKIENIPEIKITQEVEANAVFAIIPREYISTLQEVYSFYVWSEEKSEVRWMTAFDTTKEDIENFVAEIEKICFSKL